MIASKPVTRLLYFVVCAHIVFPSQDPIEFHGMIWRVGSGTSALCSIRCVPAAVTHEHLTWKCSELLMHVTTQMPYVVTSQDGR